MRVAIDVDRKKLAEALLFVEKDGPLVNQQAVWDAAAEVYNKTAAKEIGGGTVRNRAMQWGIKVITPVGKRGRAAGIPMDPEHKKRMLEAGAAARASGKGRGGKVKNHPHRAASRKAQIEELERNNATRFLPLVELAVNGNRRAADKLGCLGCVGYVTAEVRMCKDIACSHWLGRPFQKFADSVSIEEMEAAEMSEPDEELEAVA
jgi:hypothetical protein